LLDENQLVEVRFSDLENDPIKGKRRDTTR
jgi:hypothetical protein